VIGLSNNHARDCYDDEGESRSSKITVPGVQSIADGKNWIWHGVADTEANEKKVAIGTFKAGGRTVKVAFGSGYTGRPTCPLAVCKSDLDPLMQAMEDADVDLRILALHSVGKADQLELARIGQRFVEKFGGDVVYGSGPHVWSRVQVARKPNGKPGVVFESLGNFIHPGLGTQARNIIGRALFDSKTLELKQVQVIPISGAGARMRFATSPNLADPTLVGNIRFTGSAAIKGGYVNVRQAQ
jgi:poly-gamma-glutamate synthesis protein (capsule biosynthesis protein)